MSDIPRDERLGREAPGDFPERPPARGIHEEKQVEGAGADIHASRHATGGADVVTPGSIGASQPGHGHPPLHNTTATAAPGVDDDETQGYSIRSIWIDVSTPKAYICIDASEGAADWNQIDAGGGGGDIGSDTIWDALGDLVYGSADDTGAKLAGNTTATKKYLTQTGDGMVSAAPGWNVIADADVPASHSGSAHHAADHKDRHDPQTGADPLDTAAPNDLFPDNVNAEGNADSVARSDHDHAIDCATPLEIAQVQAGAEGGDYNFARAEHAHAINHGVTDNHIVTVDDAGGLVADEYPQCTANGLRSRSTTELMGDLPTATTAQKGAVSELATTAEVTTGTDTGRAVTPSGLPSQIQDSKWIYWADTGAADAYVITPAPAIAAYAAGQLFFFNATNANTGASTLNVNAKGAKAIKKNHDGALAANDIEAGSIVGVVYDGTNFQMVSQLANVAAGGGSSVVVAVLVVPGYMPSVATDDIALHVPAPANITLTEIVARGRVASTDAMTLEVECFNDADASQWDETIAIGANDRYDTAVFAGAQDFDKGFYLKLNINSASNSDAMGWVVEVVGTYD